MTGTPRWFTEQPDGHSATYARRMRRLAREGSDLDGEARFLDALLPRNSRVLDAGCGGGRTGAALHARGHSVVGVDIDEQLVSAARADHPAVRWEVADLATLDPAVLDGVPFDAAVLAGNVMVYLAPGTEAEVLRRLAAALRPDGVLVTGFATDRTYGLDEFDRHCSAAGLRLEHRFATWDLRPWVDGAPWAVSVLRRF